MSQKNCLAQNNKLKQDLLEAGFEELVADKIIVNTRNACTTKEDFDFEIRRLKQTKRSWLGGAFTWIGTPEGHAYWNNVYDEMFYKLKE